MSWEFRERVSSQFFNPSMTRAADPADVAAVRNFIADGHVKPTYFAFPKDKEEE